MTRVHVKTTSNVTATVAACLLTGSASCDADPVGVNGLQIGAENDGRRRSIDSIRDSRSKLCGEKRRCRSGYLSDDYLSDDYLFDGSKGFQAFPTDKFGGLIFEFDLVSPTASSTEQIASQMVRAQGASSPLRIQSASSSTAKSPVGRQGDAQAQPASEEVKTIPNVTSVDSAADPNKEKTPEEWIICIKKLMTLEKGVWVKTSSVDSTYWPKSPSWATMQEYVAADIIHQIGLGKFRGRPAQKWKAGTATIGSLSRGLGKGPANKAGPYKDTLQKMASAALPLFTIKPVPVDQRRQGRVAELVEPVPWLAGAFALHEVPHPTQKRVKKAVLKAKGPHR